MAIKGVALTVYYFCLDSDGNNLTGDVANHSIRVANDSGTAAATNAPAEVDATNFPGLYKVTLTIAEMTTNSIAWGGKTSTSGARIIGGQLATEQGDLAEIMEDIGDASAGGTSIYGLLTGGGSRAVTITVLELDDVTPIADVEVTVMNSDSSLMLTDAVTNASGQVVIGLDDGTYKVRLRKAGVSFTVPETLTVSGDTSDTYNGDSATIQSPNPASQCRVYEYLFQQDGATPMLAANVVAKAQILALPADSGDALWAGSVVDGTYNANTGLVYWDIAQGAKVKFTINKFLPEPKVEVVPAQASVRLTDLPLSP